jgi:DNA-binding beta-propeller fold protein YncE
MRREILAWLLPLALVACGGGNNNGDEICDNGEDDDADGDIDCGDGDCAADAACLNPPAVVGGFTRPESVFFNEVTDSWYVSNQGGQGAGDGFISKLDAAGNVVARQFVDGLDNPRGVRTINGTLFVADDAGVVVIDLLEGQILTTVAIAGASFLNDIAVDEATGDVFVSDTNTDTIHRLAGGNTPSVFLQDAQLNGPNGLLFEGGTLFIASFQGGQLFAFDPASDPALSVISDAGLGNLDGLERDGEELLTTDFGGRLLSVDANGQERVLVDGTDGTFNAAADIGFDPARRVVAVPELGGTEVSFFDLDDL